MQICQARQSLRSCLLMFFARGPHLTLNVLSTQKKHIKNTILKFSYKKVSVAMMACTGELSADELAGALGWCLALIC